VMELQTQYRKGKLLASKGTFSVYSVKRISDGKAYVLKV
jgi:hypothetical protein